VNETHCVSKKRGAELLHSPTSIINQFWKFFHSWK